MIKYVYMMSNNPCPAELIEYLCLAVEISYDILVGRCEPEATYIVRW